LGGKTLNTDTYLHTKWNIIVVLGSSYICLDILWGEELEHFLMKFMFKKCCNPSA